MTLRNSVISRSTLPTLGLLGSLIFGVPLAAGEPVNELTYVAIVPCRAVDTRDVGLGLTFGSPSMLAGVLRDFPIWSSSGCTAANIPSTVQAYTLNFTVVPSGPLHYITAWPTGAVQPTTSMLNSPQGFVVANGATIQADPNGSISVFATDMTDLVIDVNGYFIQKTPGPTGPVGPTGANGIQGPSGPQGPPGSTGETGAAGAPGAIGLPGLTFQQVWLNTTPYAIGDVVFFNGSSYVSLTAANGGNSPDVSPTVWSLLAQQGTTGPQGPRGSTGNRGDRGQPGQVGSTGPNGPIGPQGLPGAIGETGSQGLIGLPGLTFKPLGWLVATPYAIGDVVFFGGSSYVSLTAANIGNSPEASPTFWTFLAQQGATGITGDPGPTGTTGSTGAQGPIGNTGLIGPQGATGTTGDTGPIGPIGLPGLVFHPEGWLIATPYAIGDVVFFGGSSYVSLTAANTGNSPEASPTFWTFLAKQGDIGTTGSTGETGPTGPAGSIGPLGLTGAAGPLGPQGIAGPVGPQGSTGNAGPAGLTFKAQWNSSATYNVSDLAFYNGSSYVAVATNTAAQPDISFLYWSLLAQQGGIGQTGPVGTTGLTGATGPTGLTGTPGTPGLPGFPGLPGPIGLTGPAGPTGPAGANGAAGTAGTTFMLSGAGSGSANPVALTTILGGLVGNVSALPLSGFLSTPNSGQLIGGVFTFADDTNIGGVMQPIPIASNITTISASVITDSSLALVGTTITLQAQLFKATSGGGAATAVPGAICTLSPALSGPVPKGTIATCITSGLSIPYAAGDLGFVVVSATAAGLTLINAVNVDVSVGTASVATVGPPV